MWLLDHAIRKRVKKSQLIVGQPRIAAVDMNMYEIGKEAGSILLKKINYPNLRIQTFTSEPFVFEREST